MTDQSQFDRLRRDSAARLKHLVSVAHQTDEYLSDVSVPIDMEGYRQFMLKREIEYDACHAYLLASQLLADFLKEHVQYIQ